MGGKHGEMGGVPYLEISSSLLKPLRPGINVGVGGGVKGVAGLVHV